MPIFVLDTDTLSLHQRQHPKVGAAITAHSADNICISTVTIEEQISGWSSLARSAKSAQEHERASLFLSTLIQSWSSFSIAPFTGPAIVRFEGLDKQKLNVKKNDLRIAAIAMELGAIVVTRNRRDFSRVSGLVIEDWSN